MMCLTYQYHLIHCRGVYAAHCHPHLPHFQACWDVLFLKTACDIISLIRDSRDGIFKTRTLLRL
jgi:hypothetical protein